MSGHRGVNRTTRKRNNGPANARVWRAGIEVSQRGTFAATRSRCTPAVKTSEMRGLVAALGRVEWRAMSGRRFALAFFRAVN